MLKYFLGSYLIFTKESGFRPVDSWVTQLLSIAHVFTSFDNGVEVKGVILDISKAVDRWIICKLNQYFIKNQLLCLLIDFLKNCPQKVVLNDQFPSWTRMNAGVAWGSILEPLLYLNYINDLRNGWQSNVKLFANTIFLLYKISPQTLLVETMISQKSLNWQ